MKIVDFLHTQNDEDKLAFLLCANEYDLPNFGDKPIYKCYGANEENCKKCWDYALNNINN